MSRELNTSAETDAALRDTLALMERQLTDINATVARKRQLMEEYQTSGSAGSKHPFSQLTLLTTEFILY